MVADNLHIAAPFWGNGLVTELLLKSALSCLLQIEQFYANHFIFCSLSVSFRKLRFFFIFFRLIALQNITFW
ncbi:hypothetical protein HMPREF1860_01734 [Prevotella amnii]|uniref:Uncharacterized protein n=1 Tax=Prevotella amnii TaxID=419005 RepID=A0A134B6X9_9BACT|nr:hypothetical protein HMPREF1860_01734 [Prevotella amnii]